MISTRWLLYLAIPALWTIAFSMSNSPGIRGWRNLGWPACYLVGFAMFWSVGWRQAGATWLCVGFTTGLAYYVYQAWSLSRDPEPTIKAELSTVLHGAFAWPIMLPELIEYFLADVGILKAAPIPVAKGPDESSSGV